MRADLIHTLTTQLPFAPNPGQEQLIARWASFLVDRNPRRCFILRGYAGTGKTALLSALVRALSGLQVPCVLLSPTGRAARVMSRYSGMPAFTIHRAIYRRQRDGHFALSPNGLKRGVFIVDEAGMLSAERDNTLFGSGSLLDDLVRHVYSVPHCYLILVGDDAQLPPIGQTSSLALSADFLSGYGLTVYEHVLTEVARQALDSIILRNATSVRLSTSIAHTLNHLLFAPDFVRLAPSEVSSAIERSYASVGMAETIILTRSNFRANIYNAGVRAQILWKEELLSAGDRLMVSRNNYFSPSGESEDEAFLANGEMLEVRRLRGERELYGFHFVDALLSGIDRPFEIERTLWLDTLSTDRPEDAHAMLNTLFSRIALDYPEIHNRAELVKQVTASPYYNALCIRYAYAVTCHKAQGGQWKHVYIDVPRSAPDSATTWSDTEQQRWLYTAITRATERVYWVEPEKNERT